MKIKKILSLALALCLCMSFFAVMPASADEVVPVEKVLVTLDGDSAVTAAGSVGAYTAMNVTSGGDYPVDFAAMGFKHSKFGDYIGDTPYTDFIYSATENDDSYLVNKWYALQATPKGKFNINSLMTYPKLEYSFSFKSVGSPNDERRFILNLGTTETGNDFLALQLSFYHNPGKVKVIANGTTTETEIDCYNISEWNDLKVVGTFTEGAKATFSVTLNETSIADITSAIDYSKSSKLYVSTIQLQNGSSTGPKVRTTYYNNLKFSVYELPKTPVNASFDLDGGSLNSDKTEWFEGDALPRPTLPGYEFNGWKYRASDATTSSDTDVIVGDGLYTAYWEYKGGEQSNRILSHWENNLTVKDPYGVTTNVFALGGSYASTEGNEVEVTENSGTRVHAPQFNMNYYNGLAVHEDNSVVRLDYKIMIPDDENKTALRKTTFSLATYDSTQTSNSDKYKAVIPLVLEFKDGKAAAQEEDSNLFYAFYDSADVKYGEWMDVTVFAHIVDGGKTDYEVLVDGKTILKAVDEKKDRQFSTVCVRTIRFDQAQVDGVAYYDTYYKNVKVSVENRPIEIIRKEDNLTIKAGATGLKDGMLYVGIFSKENRLVKALLGSEVDENGFTKIVITDAEELEKCYAGTYTAKAFFWSSDGNITPISSFIGERVYLYK